MRKSTLLLSAILTAFTLAILVGTASAYREIANLKQPVVAAAMEEAPVQEITDQTLAPAAPLAALLSAEDAAAIASKVMGRTDLYSVETTQLDGVDAFLVTFSSGDLVYVGMDGEILLVSEIPVTVVTQPRSGGGDGHSRGGGESSSDHESEHEDEHEDEHEGEHED